MVQGVIATDMFSDGKVDAGGWQASGQFRSRAAGIVTGCLLGSTVTGAAPDARSQPESFDVTGKMLTAY